MRALTAEGGFVTAAHGAERTRASDEARLRAAVTPHLDAVWLFVRRLGVQEADCDDLVQEAILVVAKRLADIAPGAEKSFLFSTAYKMSADARRRHKRKNEASADHLDERYDSSPDVTAALDQRRALEELDRVLEDMPLELRAVFVLHELEERTMAEIAGLLAIASGTVASRLRRAREIFSQSFAHYRAETVDGEVTP